MSGAEPPPGAARSFTLRGRLESFGHAFRGIATLIQRDHNARIHACATLVVLALGLALEISRQEWLAIVLAIALVWVAEALNSALELLCDLVSPERHPTIKQVKDVAAAAVLMAALGSVVVAALVFGSRLLPYFYYLF